MILDIVALASHDRGARLPAADAAAACCCMASSALRMTGTRLVALGACMLLWNPLTSRLSFAFMHQYSGPSRKHRPVSLHVGADASAPHLIPAAEGPGGPQPFGVRMAVVRIVACTS